MSETKSIHDVAQMVGINRKESEDILKEIQSNRAKLEKCSRHDFSICLDRYTKQPIENPDPGQRFGANWGCKNCGGWVDGLARIWYNKGISMAECVGIKL